MTINPGYPILPNSPSLVCFIIGILLCFSITLMILTPSQRRVCIPCKRHRYNSLPEDVFTGFATTYPNNDIWCKPCQKVNTKCDKALEVPALPLTNDHYQQCLAPTETKIYQYYMVGFLKTDNNTSVIKKNLCCMVSPYSPNDLIRFERRHRRFVKKRYMPGDSGSVLNKEALWLLIEVALKPCTQKKDDDDDESAMGKCAEIVSVMAGDSLQKNLKQSWYWSCEPGEEKDFCYSPNLMYEMEYPMSNSRPSGTAGEQDELSHKLYKNTADNMTKIELTEQSNVGFTPILIVVPNLKLAICDQKMKATLVTSSFG